MVLAEADGGLQVRWRAAHGDWAGRKEGAMPMDTIDRGAIYAALARAQEVLLEAQETRWWAARTRQQARLLRLARFMPRANGLTLTVRAALLTQRGLLAKLTV